MQHIRHSQLQRMQLLSRTLEDISDKRHELVQQLHALDTREKAVRTERNALHNSNVPIAILPDEILALVFGEGMNPRDESSHFAVLVSHVSRRWRDVALATPRLWTSIRFFAPVGSSCTKGSENQAAVFLSRAGTSPVGFCFEGQGIISKNILQHLSDHIGRCRQLRTRDVRSKMLKMILSHISSQPKPLLSSIDLGTDKSVFITFLEQLFPSGVSHLTTARLDCINVVSMPLCLPAFESLTSLKLTCVDIGNTDDHSSFRDALMTMKSLIHLELEVIGFAAMPSSCLPVVMPTLQFLHVCNHKRHSIKIPPIHAEALVILSLEGRLRTGSIENIMPSLRHLILSGDKLKLDKMSRAFPAIERLTCPFVPEYNIDHVLATIGLGSSDLDETDGDISAGHSRLNWPRLYTIAASASKSMLEGGMLRYRISDLQAAGHSLRKVMLPNILYAHMGAKAMAELRKVVEVEDFSLDWPTPFDWY